MIKSNQYFSNITVRRMNQKTKKVRTGVFILFDISYIIVCLLIIYGVFQLFQDDVRLMTKVETVKAQADKALNKEIITVEKKIPVVVEDKRVTRLKTFLESKSSPLSSYAQTIVDEADKNGIDFTKIVAISGIESQYCLQTMPNSHNCWGIGGSNFHYYSSYEEGIAKASALLANNYRLNENQGIKEKYCPSSDGCNPNWAHIVTKYSKEILEKSNN